MINLRWRWQTTVSLFDAVSATSPLEKKTTTKKTPTQRNTVRDATLRAMNKQTREDETEI